MHDLVNFHDEVHKYDLSHLSDLCRSLEDAELEYPIRNGEVLRGHVSLPE